MSMRRISALVLLAPVLVAAFPTWAQAQASVSVSPIIGAGNFPGSYRGLPVEVSESSRVSMDAVAVLGLQAELRYGEVPVRLRVGGVRTVDGSLRVQSGLRTSSCGPRCTRAEVLYESVGDAAVSMAFMDLVFAPFSWTVSPYLQAGVAYRRASFAPADAELARYLGDSRSQVMRRVGLGMEVAVLRDSAIWLEASWHRSGRDGRGWNQTEAGWAPVVRQNLAVLGMRFPLF